MHTYRSRYNLLLEKTKLNIVLPKFAELPQNIRSSALFDFLSIYVAMKTNLKIIF